MLRLLRDKGGQHYKLKPSFLSPLNMYLTPLFYFKLVNLFPKYSVMYRAIETDIFIMGLKDSYIALYNFLNQNLILFSKYEVRCSKIHVS